MPTAATPTLRPQAGFRAAADPGGAARVAAGMGRRHRRGPCVAGAVLLSALLAPAAQARDIMTWVMPDFAPASIPQDGKPGKGIADQAVNYVMQHWTGVQHRFIYANATRTWQMLSQGDEVCFAAALRTPERERIAYFSNTNRVPPPQLVVHTSALPRVPMNAAGEADLDALLAQEKLRGLLVEKRSYGAVADGLIARRPASARLQTTPAGNYGKNIFKMIVAGRADYTLDYDFAYTYELAQAPELSALKTVPVAGSGAPVTVGVACPRTPWGRAAILKIDRLLGTREGAAALVRAQSTWQTESSRQRYAADTADFARQRAKPAPAADFE